MKAAEQGGGTICYFSVNLWDRFLGPMVLDAFCHIKTENNFENFETLFLTPPPTRGLKNQIGPIKPDKLKSL